MTYFDKLKQKGIVTDTRKQYLEKVLQVQKDKKAGKRTKDICSKHAITRRTCNRYINIKLSIAEDED